MAQGNETMNPILLLSRRVDPPRQPSMMDHLDDFMRLAETIGMPVEYIRHLQGTYGWVGHPVRGQNFVLPNFNTIFLQLKLVRQAGNFVFGQFSPGSEAIQTLYHETSHAYFDLRSDGDELFEQIARDAHEFYEREAVLKNGADSEYPWRLMNEAIGCYVGARAATYWGAYDMLEYIERNRDDPEIEPAALREQLKKLRDKYNRGMARRAFGYEQHGNAWSGTRWETSTPIYEPLQKICDSVLLEGKIPDLFDASGPLRNKYAEVMAMLN